MHWLTALLSLVAGCGFFVFGMAVNAANPVVNFGAFTQGTLQQLLAVLGATYSTFAAGVTTGTIPQGVLTGGLNVYLNSAATTPGTQTTRTAAQLFADAAAYLGAPLTDPSLVNGYQYSLTITQTGAGTFTLAGGTGVTLSDDTATIATGTTKTFVVNLLPNAATFTEVSVGSYS